MTNWLEIKLNSIKKDLGKYILSTQFERFSDLRLMMWVIDFSGLQRKNFSSL
jgi:hypothetical protein